MKNKNKNPYQCEIKTVKLSECPPDDIRVKLAKKVLADSQRVLQEPDYHTEEAQSTTHRLKTGEFE